MKGALIILAVTIIVGAIIYLLDRFRNKRMDSLQEKGPEESNISTEENQILDEENKISDDLINKEEESEECCGMHLTCEKDTLSPFSSEVEYYDDEELDRFRGKGAKEYTLEEIEEIREVFETLRQEDIPGWARSITQRGIELPEEIREELLFLVNEERASRKYQEKNG